MSDTSKPKAIALQLTVQPCDKHHQHITDAEIVEIETMYEAADAEQTIGASVGWNQLYGDNWARNFDDSTN